MYTVLFYISQDDIHTLSNHDNIHNFLNLDNRLDHNSKLNQFYSNVDILMVIYSLDLFENLKHYVHKHNYLYHVYIFFFYIYTFKYVDTILFYIDTSKNFYLKLSHLILQGVLILNQNEQMSSSYHIRKLLCEYNILFYNDLDDILIQLYYEHIHIVLLKCNSQLMDTVNI